jgi:undecaprenyl-diphosphatase
MNKKLIYAISSLVLFICIFLLVIFSNHVIDLKISGGMSKINTIYLNSLFMFLGNYSNLIMLAIALLFLGIFISMKKKKQAWIFTIALACGSAIEKIIKFLFERQRPNTQLIQDLENSFPSGHATFAIILFSLLIYFYKDEIKSKVRKNWFIVVNIFLILFIGFSRVYINAHWFSDVLGGFALGFFVLNIILFIFENKKKN